MNTDNSTWDDPWGMEVQPAEWATIGVFIAVQLVNLIGGIYSFYHRNYTPIKIKQVNIMLLTLLAGLFWSLGTLAAQRTLPQVGYPAFLVCDLWGGWLQVVFGAYLFYALLIFRLWRLYAIVKLRYNVSTWKFKLTFLLIWIPTLSFGIVASAVRALGPVTASDGIYRCNFATWAKIMALAILGVYGAAFVFFVVVLRKIKQKYLSEYVEGRTTGILFVALYVTYIILTLFNTQYFMWGRVLPVYMSFLPCTFSFWATLGPALYHCLVDKEEYEKVFRSKLNDVSSDKYQNNSKSHKSPSATSPEQSEIDMENGMKESRSAANIMGSTTETDLQGQQ